jgi:phosphomannomutase
MGDNSLIFTFSGIRGIFGKDLNSDVAKKIAISFGEWFNGKDKKIIIGRDTRPSGKIIEEGVIEGLITAGFKVVNVGICPTPIIIFAKNKLNIPAGIIITGSHNPQEWNGLKLLSSVTYLHNNDLEQISHLSNQVNLNNYRIEDKNIKKNVSSFSPISDYVQNLYKHLNIEKIRDNNNLKVIVDTGAGAGKYATPLILKGMGCEVEVINNDLLVNKLFPREIEPIKNNLKDLIMEVWQGNHDVGFAHDSDADRLAIIGENGICYPEDVGLALIAEDYLKNNYSKAEDVTFITNLASSLMFDVIAEKYDAEVIRTQIGEVFLVEKMQELMNIKNRGREKCFIFGGEGSCGGVMFPNFNNTRDGLFAAAKIVEILVNSGEKISKLVSKLPKYYSYRKNINLNPKDKALIINKVKQELIDEGEEVDHIGHDLRFSKEKEWFVLIHPSNTEPIIRVITEAKVDSLARIYCEATTELIKLVISNLK